MSLAILKVEAEGNTTPPQYFLTWGSALSAVAELSRKGWTCITPLTLRQYREEKGSSL